MIIEPTEYKATTTTNKQRIHAFKGLHPLGGIPSIIWDESFLSYDSIADRLIVNEVGSVATSMTDPAKPLALRNTSDDTILPIELFIAKLTAQGGAVYEDVFIFLYSLGRQAQIERDEAMIAARNA